MVSNRSFRQQVEPLQGNGKGKAGSAQKWLSDGAHDTWSYVVEALCLLFIHLPPSP